MKMVLSLALAAVLSIPAFAQSETGPVMTFDETVVDYGVIEEKSNGTREFSFKNTGNEPLIIQRAQGSCGCTVPEWPRDPIMPGEEGVIKVTYDTKRIGNISKSVSIYSNAINSDSQGRILLRIKGEVKKKAEAPTSPVKEEEGSKVRNK